MNTTRAVLAVFLMALFAGSAFADDAADAGKSLTVRTFALKHKEIERAAAIIKPLMSAEGTIALQPSSNAIAITDRSENLKAISAALAQYDLPPQSFRLQVRVVAAGRASGTPAVPADLREVAAKLAILKFNDFQNLGQAAVEGTEGGAGAFNLDSGYRADFKFGEYDAATDSIRVSDFRLLRVQGDQAAQIMKTTLNLKLGQTVILTATRLPESQRAVMLVLTARR
jgi:hypothetical protein